MWSKKIQAYRAMEVCILYYLILSTNGGLFHAAEVQTKEDEVVTCGTKLCISVVKCIISFFVIVEVQAKTKK